MTELELKNLEENLKLLQELIHKLSIINKDNNKGVIKCPIMNRI